MRSPGCVLAATRPGMLKPLCWHAMLSPLFHHFAWKSQQLPTACTANMSLQGFSFGMLKSPACTVISMTPQNKVLGGCRYLLILGNSMQKVICGFNNFSEDVTSETIEVAYAAANKAAADSPQFFIATRRPPSLSRHRYEVEVQPRGYSASCTDEQVNTKASRHSLLLHLLLSKPTCWWG